MGSCVRAFIVRLCVLRVSPWCAWRELLVCCKLQKDTVRNRVIGRQEKLMGVHNTIWTYVYHYHSTYLSVRVSVSWLCPYRAIVMPNHSRPRGFDHPSPRMNHSLVNAAITVVGVDPHTRALLGGAPALISSE